MKTPHFLFMPLITISTTAVLLAQTASQEVWDPQVAGRCDPENEIALKDQINTFLNNIPKQSLKGRPVALISPHAGYQYSGQVAAYGYNAIKDTRFTRVIILSPSHFKRVPIRGNTPWKPNYLSYKCR